MEALGLPIEIDTPGPIELPIGEIVKLGASDTSFFSKTFFPRTVRGTFAPFHRIMDAELEHPRKRFVNLRAFRGSAKTTKLRIFTAKRIAYSMSRTILYVGASEAHASRSIQWLRGQVERNKLFSSCFGLSPGKKWSESELEIEHGVDGQSIWMLGVGITGNIRGINFDDYRPDLIILDDVITDENANTEEQREKINDLILGAVKNSLASEVDAPNAKLVMLQTPLHEDDASSLAMRDRQWSSTVISCWTPETQNSPLHEQVSSWPQEHPTDALRADKAAAIDRNAYYIFAREKECKLVTAEHASFKPEWLQTYEEPPVGGMTILAIDPVPPPTEKQMANALKGKDYEAQVVVTKKNGEYFVREVVTNKGHQPNWSVTTALRLASEYRVNAIVVESVGYQAVLKSILQEAMVKTGVFFLIKPLDNKRNKFVRITSSLSGVGAARRLFVRPSHTELRQQWAEFPSGKHDDILDALAMAVADLNRPFLDLDSDEYAEIEDDDFEYVGGAP